MAQTRRAKGVKRLIDTAYATAKELILKHRDKLNAIAEALLEFETLDGEHIREIMEHGKMLNPPRSPKPPDLPADEEAVEEEPKKKKADEDDGELPGELEGAPVGA